MVADGLRVILVHVIAFPPGAAKVTTRRDSIKQRYVEVLKTMIANHTWKLRYA